MKQIELSKKLSVDQSSQPRKAKSSLLKKGGKQSITPMQLKNPKEIYEYNINDSSKMTEVNEGGDLLT